MPDLADHRSRIPCPKGREFVLFILLDYTHNGRMFKLQVLRSFVVLLVLISCFPPAASAGRSLRLPTLFWHDWQFINSWGTPPAAYYQKTLELVLTNIASTTTQNIAIKVTGTSGAFKTTPATPLISYTFNSQPANGASYTLTISLPPADTKKLSFGAQYLGAAGAPINDVHFLGAFDVEITVTEDRGALIGTWLLTYEQMNVVTDMTGHIPPTLLKSAMQSGTLNGGRPF